MAAGDLELWGGAECTVNRVGDAFRDQLRATGHHHRDTDFALIAGLGIRTVRFPVLWERVAPGEDGRCDWQWSDARMAELERLGIAPIVGLLHHGSGPLHTSLIDDQLPELFARYAGMVAARYPHVQNWTPINEPLTTARFSTLYGTWYPHATDRDLFWRAMVIQTEATIAAMRAIRRIIPSARLVQTDDLGETTCEPGVEAIADYYNHRRWLGWDLLCGRVTREHPLWEEGKASGMGARLEAVAADPCPPALIGIDHYVTSDRHLVPAAHAPGYVDDPALRASPALPAGLAGALRQAWGRYRIPLAITECHLGCTREEQVRWLRRGWDTAMAVRAEGVDVRAVTAWSMFGAMDWDSLLTVEAGRYESGVFDIGAGTPRPTAIARLAASLSGAAPCSPTLDELARQPGWWEREVRFGTAPASPGQAVGASAVLILDGEGALPGAFAAACLMRGLRHEIVPPGGVAEALRSGAVWAVIGSGIDAAARDTLAELCTQADIRLAMVEPEATDGTSVIGGLVIRGDPTSLESDAARAELVRMTLDLLIDEEDGEWQLLATPHAGPTRLVRVGRDAPHEGATTDQVIARGPDSSAGPIASTAG